MKNTRSSRASTPTKVHTREELQKGKLTEVLPRKVHPSSGKTANFQDTNTKYHCTNCKVARSRARLLAAGRKESGAWLNALPVPLLGLRMEDETTRVAVGLRLGTPLCRPHECSHCGATVDDLATHGLSCRWSEGRHPHHAAVNVILHRSLSSAKIPSSLYNIILFKIAKLIPQTAKIFFHKIFPLYGILYVIVTVVCCNSILQHPKVGSLHDCGFPS